MDSPKCWLRCYCVLGEDAALYFGLHAPEARTEALIIISLRNAEFTLELNGMRKFPSPRKRKPERALCDNVVVVLVCFLVSIN